jgi:outer membrane biosynthesis protein TonB
VAEAPPPAPERSARKKKKSSREPEERPKGDAPGSSTRGLALGAAPDVDGESGGAIEQPMAVPGDRRAKLGALSVSGARGKKELAADIAAALGPAAELCAQLAGEGGEVTLAFEIDRAGAVGDVKVTGPRGLVAKVGTCLREKVEQLGFPRRREGTTGVRQSVRFEVP